MEARNEHQQQKRFNILYGVTTALGLLLIVLVIIWASYFRGGFSWSSNPKLEFNWHPVCMTIGLIFLYSQSILIYRSKRNLPKKKLKLLHTAIHSFSFLFAVIGLQAVFDAHNLAVPPIPNLYTLHSWIGLFTVILFAYQLATGFITFLYPGLGREIRSALMPIHVAVGTGTFTLALISAASGLLEKAIFAIADNYSARSSEAWLINCMGMILVCFGLMVHYLVNDAAYKRIALPEDELVLTNNPDEGSSVFTKEN